MRIIRLFCCLSALVFSIASDGFRPPEAIAQPPAGDAAPDSVDRLQPSVESQPPSAGQDAAVQPSLANPLGADLPPPTHTPGRTAAVVHGVRVFLPKMIDEISVDIRQPEVIPLDFATAAFRALERGPSRDQTWVSRQFMWQASEFWHRPLYFDDVPLERYGQMRHPLVQPILSGAHFFGNLPLLPYKMGVDRPCDEIATLGYYRPGSAAPEVGRRLPLEADAASFEAATWIGLILLLP